MPQLRRADCASKRLRRSSAESSTTSIGLANGRRNDDEFLSQFSDPRTGEMLTRWDMIAAPPDVLVTNYSMLNAMLMRELEDPLFDKTRRWIDAGARSPSSLTSFTSTGAPREARSR